MTDKRLIINWLRAVPGGSRESKIDEEHVEYRSWWSRYRKIPGKGFGPPPLREISIRFTGTHEMDGEYKEWYENGQLRIHSFYKEGRVHGEYKRWTDTGELEERAFFNRGEEVQKPFVNASPGYILADGNYYPDEEEQQSERQK